MIGYLLFLNSRGDIAASRGFREGGNLKHMAEAFRTQVIAANRADRSPIHIIDKTAFLHMRFASLYLVACCREDVNAAMVFQYMVRLLQVLGQLFGHDSINEETLKEHFVAVQEVMDETMDYGWPQETETGILRAYLSEDGMKAEVAKRAVSASAITARATGRVPWRKEGILYRQNEVYVEVNEEVNALLGREGEVLQCGVVGSVTFKGFLSGMPDCRLHINDRNGPSSSSGLGGVGVAVEDVAFHTCVRLHEYDASHIVAFIPPDGAFNLMTYRVSQGVQPPIRIVMPHVKESSKSRTEIDFVVKCDLPPGKAAADVVVRVPCPHNTASVAVRVKEGKAKYKAAEQAVVWKLGTLTGNAEAAFSVEIALIAATLHEDERRWRRPPLSVRFNCGGFSASGLTVSQLTIEEPKQGYVAKKWVKYATNGGQYECRL